MNQKMLIYYAHAVFTGLRYMSFYIAHKSAYLEICRYLYLNFLLCLLALRKGDMGVPETR